MIAAIIFGLSVLALFHSYLLYPFLLKIFSTGKKHNDVIFSEQGELPVIYVLMSVYNEEKVLEEKLRSVFASGYPTSKLKVLVGSDNSTDRTNEILKNLSIEYSNLQFRNFDERLGKSNILNNLVASIGSDALQSRSILVFTDANVIFTPFTIFELVKHFKNPEIAVVGANILNKGFKKEGISMQEKFYIGRENQIKYLEGLNWGTMMGAFGACYAIRADYFGFIPKNFLMEDFYITMNALKMKGKAITEPHAICHEDVSDDIVQEFKRKVRISTGNYQNLKVFYNLLFPVFSPLSFCFFSHKVLRWMGPFLIIAAYLSSLALSHTSNFYLVMFLVQTALLLVPAIDLILKAMGVHTVVLRFISYFYFMNLALVFGLVKFLRGIETNAWEPTKRNRS